MEPRSQPVFRRQLPSRWQLGAAAVAALAGTLVLAGAPSSARADQTLTFDGTVPIGAPDHFYIPFTVPAGIHEIEVRHDNQSPINILDWGLMDGRGYRGWGGGTKENAVVGDLAASRAYVPGSILPGEWRVVVGKAKIIESPARYHVEVTLRNAPTLPPQPQRFPYTDVAALRKTRRYYAGDLHTHSLESTDAQPTLTAMVQLARNRGLDFLVITDHNTVTQLDFFAEVQRNSPDVLLVPGIEVTTYAGHAGAIGATRFVEHKVGLAVPSFAEVAAAIHGQGAWLSINHPVLNLGDVCIGCAWQHPLDNVDVNGVEIGTGGLQQGGILFAPGAIKFWDHLLAQGRHVAAVGGSDDHLAGKGMDARSSPIGDPTTLIWAEELSVPALLAGLRSGRTVVKLQGPADPMIELGAGERIVGDTVAGRSVVLSVRVTEGRGHHLRFVKNGTPDEEFDIDADPFVLTKDVVVPSALATEDRWRVEVLVDKQPRTVSSHMYVRWDPSGPDPVGDRDRQSAGCAASARHTASNVGRLIVLGGLCAALVIRRRGRAARRRFPSAG